MDQFTREDLLTDFSLTNKYFFKVWDELGPVSYEIIASSSNLKCNEEGKDCVFFLDISQRDVEGLTCLPKI